MARYEDMPADEAIVAAVDDLTLTIEKIFGSKEPDPLVGKWFHTWDRKECGCSILQWQGQVTAKADAGHYLIQLYEFLMGFPTDQHVTPVADMVAWTFYDSDEEMRDAYNSYERRGIRERHKQHSADEAVTS
jgi:hypothetical protein